MRSTGGLFLFPATFAVANAFTNFRVDPTCVPNPDDNISEEILPFICKFDENSDSWAMEDCTDLPAECTSVDQKLTWATTKIHVNGQGTDFPGCSGFSVLSRDVKFPECVYGEPVPETRVGDLFDAMYLAREAAEEILAGNPTYCAAQLASKMFDIYGEIHQSRVSKVAMHGLRLNPELKLKQLEEQWDPEANDCVEPGRTQRTPENEARLADETWIYQRKVFEVAECTVIRHYSGSSFAKPHDGGFEGCKLECMDEPNCNAFNMDLRFQITMKQHSCDLLDCPVDATKLNLFGHVSFVMDSRASARERL